MRQGQQHRRGRSRHNNNQGHNHNHNRKGQNPLTRSFESNGPDVKVRGTPAHVAEKYMSLARDAQSSGDPVLAENYLQHAEHYNRIIFAFREQQAQQGGGEAMNGNNPANTPARMRMPGDPIDGDEFSEEEGQAEEFGSSEQPMVTRFPHEPQAFQRQGEGRSEEGGQSQGWTQRSQEQQGRYRDRFDRNDRHDRSDRGDRQDRHDRNDRQFDRQDRDRFGDRGDRGDRYDRPQHGSQGQQGQYDRGSHGGDRDRGDRDRQDRFADRNQRFDRRDRYQQDRQHQQGGGRERFVEPQPAPVQPPVDSMPVEARESAAVVAPAPVPQHDRPVDVPIAVEAAPAARAPREGGAAARRRERFGPGIEEPEFLRRPVRRARRDPDAAPAAEGPPPVPDEPARD